MKKSLFASLVCVSALALTAVMADPWDGYNSPEKMSRGRYVYDFDALPTEGALTEEKLPWAETYWPTYKGGIAYRWQHKIAGGSSWTYKLYSKQELQAMSPEEIAYLSPAEKFDILQGRYDYPTVASERNRTSPNAERWAGLCHGWTPAAIQHREPTPKTVVNADGIEVRFGSSDIKGLITYYYGKVDWKPVGWTNRRCKSTWGGKGCRGVNPATLHLVATNQLGLLNESFIMDRDRSVQIWNQPFYEYTVTKMGSCNVSRKSRKVGAVRGVAINLRTKWVDELPKSQWEPATVLDTETGKLKVNSLSTSYQYCLEMTGTGRIVGGEWIGKARPGFIWNHDAADFSDPYYGRVKELLND